MGKRETVIYQVTIVAPAINEVVTTSADSEDQAQERAVYSALQRQAKAATITVKAMPEGTRVSQ